MFLSWNEAKFRILYYKLFLGKRCGVQKNFRLGDDCIYEEMGLCVHFWIYVMIFVVKNLFCSTLGYVCTVGFIYRSFLIKQPD
jgi:hypothetical protein